jgi:hypothetical protein
MTADPGPATLTPEQVKEACKLLDELGEVDLMSRLASVIPEHCRVVVGVSQDKLSRNFPADLVTTFLSAEHERLLGRLRGLGVRL